MPFTMSHPAAVLPLRRVGLPMTALVVGSMAPDVPLFLGWHHGYVYAHSLWGVVTLDVAFALLGVWLWFAVVRNALVDLAPEVVRSRLTPHASLTTTQWLLVLPAAAVGALTHVVWDAFTHPGRWGVREVAWLHHQHAGLAGFSWAQYASGLIGFAIVSLSAARYLRTLSPVQHPKPRPVWATAALTAVVLAGAVAATATVAANLPYGPHAMAFHGVVNALLAITMMLFAVCIVWRCRPVTSSAR